MTPFFTKRLHDKKKYFAYALIFAGLSIEKPDMAGFDYNFFIVLRKTNAKI